MQIRNLVEDPDLRFTSTGTPVVSMRVACDDRYQDRAGKWKDGATTFLAVTAWRALAENAAESLHKGDQVVVVGSLQGREWENEAGERRTANEVTADFLGAGLGYATTVATRRAHRTEVPA